MVPGMKLELHDSLDAVQKVVRRRPQEAPGISEKRKLGWTGR